MNTEHELEALKTKFAKYKTKQEADCKKEINSLKELICDLCGDVGEIMLMHDGQEEDLNSCLDRHCFNINQLREDHNSLREDYQELEAEAAALRIHLSHMQDQLCHCADCCIPPISTVGFPDLPEVPASPEYSPEFYTPSIEVQSLGTVSSAPATLEPILVPPPVASLLPPSDSENIPPLCCSNPPPLCALLVPKWPLVFLTGTTKVEELIIRQCIPCLVASTPMLIKCNQETIVQEEGEASSIASTSNRPASIATLNDALEGMNPHQRDHPMGATMMLFLTDFQMDGILRGLQALLPCCPLSLWSLQGAVTANKLGQYRLEVSLALTEEEGNQFLGELADADRAESPEIFWEGSTDIGLEYDDNVEV